jgi:hypothetical protein
LYEPYKANIVHTRGLAFQHGRAVCRFWCARIVGAGVERPGRSGFDPFATS